MKFIDLVAIRRVREQAQGYCESCGLYARNGLQVHHLWTRGAGRLDIPINLIALGGCWDCDCHGAAQEMPGRLGNFFRAGLLVIVAQREKTTPQAIEREIYRLRNLCKYARYSNALPEESPNGPTNNS